MSNALTIAIPDEANEQITKMFISSAGDALNELIKQQQYPPYMNQKEASKYLRISVASFKKLGIPVVRLEGIERYSKKTLDEYCKENEF